MSINGVLSIIHSINAYSLLSNPIFDDQFITLHSHIGRIDNQVIIFIKERKKEETVGVRVHIHYIHYSIGRRLHSMHCIWVDWSIMHRRSIQGRFIQINRQRVTIIRECIIKERNRGCIITSDQL